MTQPDAPGGWCPTPTQAVAQRVQEVRKRHGWSAQRLADECAKVGMPGLNRSVIANLESGRRDSVAVDEVFVLAYVLGVAPVHLLVPTARESDRPVSGCKVTPTRTERPEQVRSWIRGFEPLPGTDQTMFGTERPADDDTARNVVHISGDVRAVLDQLKGMISERPRGDD